ncbi:unnamed protein product [Rotaria socialis]|uniref:Uncharacterized protein n=1 Tax=Rotaria socialis TaxID=392032 RepID=A0A817PH27_9BILA|nr:unnamed protein product [Rotaria socialis]CAF4224456.1 unnamed protein product [Rotaria socialis]CAF4267061.1 unnamed protein product [Rotaria socialis]CAF4608083.1 unnamed protein product [Rotaria socialis]
MTSVFDRINQQLGKYKRHKSWKTLFQSGKGPNVALSTLKAYAPVISYFIMAFCDFNEFVLPYETPQNALQIAANEHAKEDYTHYKLFIEDWENLSGDKLTSGSDGIIAIGGESPIGAAKLVMHLFKEEAGRLLNFVIPHGICSCLTLASAVAIQDKHLPDIEVKQLESLLPFVTKIMPKQQIDDPCEQALRVSEVIAQLIADLDLTSPLREFQVPASSFEGIIERARPDGKIDMRYNDFVTLLDHSF